MQVLRFRITMVITIVIALIMTSTIRSEDNDFSSAKYQALSAKAKQDKLWGKIVENTTSYGWFSAISAARIFLESMKPTFDYYSDSMPSGRNKYIHSVGRVAKVKFIPSSTKYSGIFKGNNFGIIRLSCAKEPNEKQTSAQQALDNFTPGFGLKFLRDGMPSANLVAMFSVNGQNSWNFFKNDFTNHIPLPEGTALKILGKKFSEATPYIGTLGTKTLGEYDSTGNKENSLNIPFKLVFKPTATLKNMFPDEFKYDFLTQLGMVKSDTILYEVHAIEDPKIGKLEKIGELITTSDFTTSRFGDKDLFFQHSYFEDDIKLHPDWEEAVKAGILTPFELRSLIASAFHK